MYADTLFRGAKRAKLEKKGVFLVLVTSFGKDITNKLRKNACRKVYLGSIFIPKNMCLLCVLKVLFTRMISSLKYKWSRGV